MTNKVIKYFTDLQDSNHEYNVGDDFPRKGKEVSKERLTELSTSNNLQGEPLIESVQAGVDYSGMKVSELKNIAKEREIEGYSDMKKNELVKVLEGGN